MKPTVDTLVARARSAPYGMARDWVWHPEFSALYMRVTLHFIEGVMRPTIDLATIQSRSPGEGGFVRLCHELRRKYPEFTLFVESVHAHRFRQKLERLGFLKLANGGLDETIGSFYLLPTAPLLENPCP
jgi:hypothetical protein